MCHSENRYGDKQNKNRWGTQTAHREYIHRKQNKNRWGLQDCGHHSENKHIDNREKRWGLQNSQDLQLKIPINFNLQHNDDENVTSIITHNRVEINLRYIRNP